MKTLNVLLVVALVTAVALAQSGGGRVPSKPAEPKPKAPVTNKRPATLDRIDGKWWTTGNDFGPSEVVFVQNGSDISGTIRWADGRTGSLTGTLVGKRLQHSWTDNTGNGGSGWLELSWANFLGGPWHNQRVKDGSWTMNRIEGQWCLGGDNKRPRRVTHDEQGRLQITTEDGTRMGGQMDSSYLILDDGEETMKGDMFYKGNRITFPNGSYWTWCGRLSE